ncbi:hypothetical protein ACP4OV_011881 [Aristida adscensionis]
MVVSGRTETLENRAEMPAEEGSVLCAPCGVWVPPEHARAHAAAAASEEERTTKKKKRCRECSPAAPALKEKIPQPQPLPDQELKKEIPPPLSDEDEEISSLSDEDDEDEEISLSDLDEKIRRAAEEIRRIEAEIRRDVEIHRAQAKVRRAAEVRRLDKAVEEILAYAEKLPLPEDDKALKELAKSMWDKVPYAPDLRYKYMLKKCRTNDKQETNEEA